MMWRIREAIEGRPIPKPQSVFRYMHKKYVDLFFKSGTLQLSSYESNRAIEDSVRQDEREGTGEYFVVSRDRSLTIQLGARAFDHRMLCTSTSSDIDRMMNHFRVDGCFEVTNTTGFGFEVAKALDAFRFGLEGIVTYQDGYRKNLLLEQHQHLPDLQSSEPSNEQLFHYLDIIGRTDHDLLFTKPLIFQQEQEYRFNWRCAPDHFKSIHCPGALKYCRRIP